MNNKTLADVLDPSAPEGAGTSLSFLQNRRGSPVIMSAAGNLSSLKRSGSIVEHTPGILAGSPLSASSSEGSESDPFSSVPVELRRSGPAGTTSTKESDVGGGGGAPSGPAAKKGFKRATTTHFGGGGGDHSPSSAGSGGGLLLQLTGEMPSVRNIHPEGEKAGIKMPSAVVARPRPLGGGVAGGYGGGAGPLQ